jgi:hypothetical protein
MRRLVIWFNILNLLDCVTTFVGVGGGYGEELNPIMGALISLGWEYFIFLKLSLGLLTSLWLYRKQAKKTLIGAVVLYAVVVMSNTIQIYLEVL